ncbi:hypothetical protein ACJJTC_003711 [Scirpophaga incertulas]
MLVNVLLLMELAADGRSALWNSSALVPSLIVAISIKVEQRSREAVVAAAAAARRAASDARGCYSPPMRSPAVWQPAAPASPRLHRPTPVAVPNNVNHLAIPLPPLAPNTYRLTRLTSLDHSKFPCRRTSKDLSDHCLIPRCLGMMPLDYNRR